MSIHNDKQNKKKKQTIKQTFSVCFHVGKISKAINQNYKYYLYYNKHKCIYPVAVNSFIKDKIYSNRFRQGFCFVFHKRIKCSLGYKFVFKLIAVYLAFSSMFFVFMHVCADIL